MWALRGGGEAIAVATPGLAGDDGLVSVSFAEIVSPIVERHVSQHAHLVLEQLGGDVRRALAELERSRRAAMVDRLVRNLHLSVTEAPALERELLRATNSEPSGTYEWRFDSATAIVDLRSGLHYLGIWLGFEWADLSRMQAVIGNFVRWAWSSGVGSLRATVGPAVVHFAMTMQITGYDARLVQSSPFVASIADVSSRLSVKEEGGTICLEFDLNAR